MRYIEHRSFRSSASVPRLVHAALVVLVILAALAAPLAVADEQLACVSPAAAASA